MKTMPESMIAARNGAGLGDRGPEPGPDLVIAARNGAGLGDRGQNGILFMIVASSR
jgi:hypothetical protein